jgi:anti-anti-sigma factor
MVLQSTVEQADGRVPVTIVALAGELDGTTYQRVIETVQGVYDAGGRQLVLDLKDLTFISSAGLVALHTSLRLMQGEAPPDPEYGYAALRAINDEVDSGTAQTNVRLCGTQDAVQKVLDRTGLGGLFPSHPDRASAIAAF